MGRTLAFDRLFAGRSGRASGRRWSRTPLACFPSGGKDSALLYVRILLFCTSFLLVLRSIHLR